MTSRCRDVLGPDLVAVWLGGSGATDDLRTAVSDVDVIVVSARPLVPAIKQTLAGSVQHAVLPCPAVGLDLAAYTVRSLGERAEALTFELSVATGATWGWQVEWGGSYPGGLIDLEHANVHGHALWGPEPPVILGPPETEALCRELGLAMAWHGRHLYDPFHDPTGSNAVLNACRAIFFATHSRLVSKTEGANWYAAYAQAKIALDALAIRRGVRSVRLRETDILMLLERAEHVLRAV